MEIEKYWIDIDVYYISFIAKNGDVKKKVDRLIAFDSNLNQNDIEASIYNYFGNVVSIEHIDYWDQGLLKNKNY